MSAADMDAIALVAGLRHRYGNRHACKCEECRALERVAALAREAVEMKRARRKPSTPPSSRDSRAGALTRKES